MKTQWLYTAVAAALLAGCVTDPYTGERRISNLGKGAGIGAAVGAGAGTLFGGNDAKNAGWGALAGGALGAAVGAYMDHQEQAMRQSLEGTGVEVQRTADNQLNLTMPSGVTFATDSATLTGEAQNSLNSVSQVLTQYPETTINVTGHTDDKGSDTYNMGLSQRRAASVAGYLMSHGVAGNRMSQQGMGKSSPKVPNTDDAARAQNRRVEIAVVARPNAGAPQGAAPPAGAPQGGNPPPQGNYPANPQGGYPAPAGNIPAGGYSAPGSVPQPQGTYPNAPGTYQAPAGGYVAPR